MNRRDFLKAASWSGLALACPGMKMHAAPGGYSGTLLFHIQVDGGWDVTSFCDPKLNVAGELPINNWAFTDDIRTAGNIAYAPVAGNQIFFEKYYRDMLVVNGLDSQTNAHTTGVTHTTSGEIAVGYPTLGSLFASANAGEIPLAYINNGGYSESAGLVRASRVGDPSTLVDILRSNNPSYTESLSETWFPAGVLDYIRNARDTRRERQLAETALSVRARNNRQAFDESVRAAASLSDLTDILPSEDQREPVVQAGPLNSTLRQQIQVGVLASEAGVTSAVDLWIPEFDTHANHDEAHYPVLSFLTESIDYLWEYAEERGISDRMVVLISSDFGRTPFYNSYGGKDHWPIGSAIVMQRNVDWGNRTIGLTDEGHNAIKVNPSTLQRDDTGGTNIYPAHVHLALRDYLGLVNHPSAQAFPFRNTEMMDIFNPALTS